MIPKNNFAILNNINQYLLIPSNTKQCLTNLVLAHSIWYEQCIKYCRQYDTSIAMAWSQYGTDSLVSFWYWFWWFSENLLCILNHKYYTRKTIVPCNNTHVCFILVLTTNIRPGWYKFQWQHPTSVLHPIHNHKYTTRVKIFPPVTSLYMCFILALTPNIRLGWQ